MQVYNDEFYSNELYHHGVKGMKWGVRNIRPRSGFMSKNRYRKYTGDRNLLRKHNTKKAMKQLDRMNEVSRDYKRMRLMDNRQRESFNKSKAYWEDVQKTGRIHGNVHKRNYIKRSYDLYRSMGTGERFIKQTINNAVWGEGERLYTKALGKALGFDDFMKNADTPAYQRAGQYVVQAAINDIGNTAISKAFGHY